MKRQAFWEDFLTGWEKGVQGGSPCEMEKDFKE